MSATIHGESRLVLEGGVIRYLSTEHRSWTMPVEDLRLIGESTNQNGPMADDYFLCFAADASGWEEASFYSEGRDSFLDALGMSLGTKLELELASSTDFASRILWPLNLNGEPMFTYSELRPRSILGRIFGSRRNRQTLSSVALSVLRAKASEADGQSESGN